MKRLVSSIIACTLLGGAAVGQTSPTGYRVRVTMPLTPGPDRMRGRLELLEDARIEPNMRSAIAGAFGDGPCTDHPPATLHIRWSTLEDSRAP